MNGSAAEREVLIIIDPQIDFCPGGALAVPGGDEIVSTVNRLARDFPHVILTQDWHPPGHRSFASAHPGRRAFEIIEVDYGAQTLWPDHCVQGTKGAAFHARWRAWPCCLHSKHSVGVPEGGVFAAQYPAYAHPCQRFTETVAGFSA